MGCKLAPISSLHQCLYILMPSSRRQGFRYTSTRFGCASIHLYQIWVRPNFKKFVYIDAFFKKAKRMATCHPALGNVSLGSYSKAVWHGVRAEHAARRGAERRGVQGVGRRCAGFPDLLAPSRAVRCALASRQTVAPVMTQGRCGCCQWQALTASRGF